MLQIGKASQFRRYLAAQTVAVEFKCFQVVEVAQLRWYLTAHIVAAYAQMCQFCKVTYLRRYLAIQADTPETQFGNATVVVGGYALPFADGGVGQPVKGARVVGTSPIGSVQGVVEGDKRFTVCPH